LLELGKVKKWWIKLTRVIARFQVQLESVTIYHIALSVLARSDALSTCCHQLSRAAPHEFTHNRVTCSLCDSIVKHGWFSFSNIYIDIYIHIHIHTHIHIYIYIYMYIYMYIVTSFLWTFLLIIISKFHIWYLNPFPLVQYWIVLLISHAILIYIFLFVIILNKILTIFNKFVLFLILLQ